MLGALKTSRSRLFSSASSSIFDATSSPSSSSMYIWGMGVRGQLGLGSDVTLCPTPTALTAPVPSRLRTASTGCEHTLVLCDDGQVFGFGCNDDGQLGPRGPRTAASAAVPRRCTFAPQLLVDDNNADVAQICCGSYHSVLVGRDGRRLTRWDASGEHVVTLADGAVAAVAAGEDWTAALLDDGAVRVWSHRVGSPAEQMFEALLDMAAHRHVHGVSVANGHWASDRCLTVQLREHARPRSLHGGWGHCLLLTDDGALFAFGHNAYGQCGAAPSPIAALDRVPSADSDAPLRAAAADCGTAHCLALGVDGRVHFWGSTADAKLDPALLAAQRPGQRTDAVSTPVVVPPPDGERGPARLVACGDNHSFVAFDSAVYGWGFGQHNAIGWAQPRCNAVVPQRVLLPEFDRPPRVISAGLDTSLVIF